MAQTREILIGCGAFVLIVISVFTGFVIEHVRLQFHKPYPGKIVCPIVPPSTSSNDPPFLFDAHNADFNYWRRPSACTQPKLYMIMVTSLAEDFDLRDSIRETWASNLSATNGSVIFFISHPVTQVHAPLELQEEQRIYGDLIFARINATNTKSRGWSSLEALSMIRWFSKYCSRKVEFMVKSENSAWWNIKRLAVRLRTFVGQRLLLGKLRMKVQVQRKLNEPWFTHRSEFASKYFPNYLNSRPGYAISSRAAVIIDRQSRRKKVMWLEDVYITGLLRWLGGLKIVALSKMVPCKIIPVEYKHYRSYLGVYGLTAKNMYDIWDEQIDSAMGKYYNWDTCG